VEVLKQPRVSFSPAPGNHYHCPWKRRTEKAALEKGAWAYVEKPYIIDRIKDILKGNFTRLDDLNSH
jgi:hypothetical protein